MKGVYSIAEVVDDSNKRPKSTVFTVLYDGFDKGECKSLLMVETMVSNNGGNVFNSINDTAKYLNSLSNIGKFFLKS